MEEQNGGIERRNRTEEQNGGIEQRNRTEEQKKTTEESRADGVFGFSHGV